MWFDRNNNGVKDEGEALLEVLYPSVKAGNLFVGIGSSNTVSIYGKFTKMEFSGEKGIISIDISQMSISKPLLVEVLILKVLLLIQVLLICIAIIPNSLL